jgi:hypothetical protein
MREKGSEKKPGSATVFVDANPERDQTFHFDAYPDPEPTFLFSMPKFYTCWKM